MYSDGKVGWEGGTFAAANVRVPGKRAPGFERKCLRQGVEWPKRGRGAGFGGARRAVAGREEVETENGVAPIRAHTDTHTDTQTRRPCARIYYIHTHTRALIDGDR